MLIYDQSLLFVSINVLFVSINNLTIPIKETSLNEISFNQCKYRSTKSRVKYGFRNVFGSLFLTLAIPRIHNSTLR